MRHSFGMLVLKMQRVSLLGRIVNISLLGLMAGKNVFMIEGTGKGNGVHCGSGGDMEQDEVTKLKHFNMEGGCQYIE